MQIHLSYNYISVLTHSKKLALVISLNHTFFVLDCQTIAYERVMWFRLNFCNHLVTSLIQVIYVVDRVKDTVLIYCFFRFVFVKAKLQLTFLYMCNNRWFVKYLLTINPLCNSNSTNFGLFAIKGVVITSCQSVS